MSEISLSVGSFSLNGRIDADTRCGGDWWGYLEVPKPRGGSSYLVLMVGDVEGHGPAQAVITESAQGALGVLSPWLQEDLSRCQRPQEILSFFNRSIFSATQGARAMTFAVVVIDRDEGKLYSCNAGQPFPFLLTPSVNGGPPNIQALVQSGLPLGRSLDSVYAESLCLPWTSGSQLLMYTDGLVDCVMNGEALFSRKDLRRLLEELALEASTNIFNRLFAKRKAKIEGFVPIDDVTAVLCSE